MLFRSEVSGEERLYFVVETKGSLFTDDLRDNEAAKIACGEAHFEALATGDNPARYIKATKIDDLMGYNSSTFRGRSLKKCTPTRGTPPPR